MSPSPSMKHRANDGGSLREHYPGQDSLDSFGVGMVGSGPKNGDSRCWTIDVSRRAHIDAAGA